MLSLLQDAVLLPFLRREAKASAHKQLLPRSMDHCQLLGLRADRCSLEPSHGLPTQLRGDAHTVPNPRPEIDRHKFNPRPSGASGGFSL